MIYRDWPVAHLGGLVSIKHGWAFKGEYFTSYKPGMPIVVSIGNFSYSGGFRFESTNLKSYIGEYPEEYILKPGDILLVMTCQTAGGEILGIPGRIPNDERKYLHNQRMGKVVVANEEKVDKSFLYQLFLTYEFNHHLTSTASGAKILHTAPDRIESFEFRLPPLPTQRKIAAILSAYDDLIENNTRRIAILEEMAQSLYREWFVYYRFPGHEKNTMVESPLGTIPQGWDVVRFTDIADVLSGGTPKTTTSEYWNGNIPFFTPRDAGSSFYVLETEKHITESGLKTCSSKHYPKNTIFITARGTVGKVLLNSVDMAMNQSCYALQGKNSIGQYFVFMTIKNCIDQLKQNAHGAVFDTIIVDTFRMLQVIKPERTLIDRFSTAVSPIFENILNLMNKNAKLRRTRDLLLPKLISGELDVEELDIEAGGDAEDAGVREEAFTRS